MGKYRTIVADPPWHYESFGSHGHRKGVRTKLPYPSMPLEEIAALPVASLAAPDARLFLWTTSKYLPASFGVLEAWGFEYRQTLIWHKTGNPSPLTGGIAPIHNEFLLVGVKGRPGITQKMPSSVIPAPKPIREHSRKPDVFLDLVEAASPGPYLELFARRARFGWDVWGNEVDSDVEMAA